MHRPELPPPYSSLPALGPSTGEWFDFLARVHGSLDLDDVAAVIVNELRRLLACDRVALVLVTRGRARVLAASGQESFDDRSNVAKAWESFTEAVAALDEPFWYDESPAGRAPQIETALQHLLDVSPARYSAVVPLRPAKETERGGDDKKGNSTKHAGDPVGWLIVERFEQSPANGPAPSPFVPLGQALAASGSASSNSAAGSASSAILRERLEMIAPHAGAALDNARRYDRLPLRKLGERIDHLAHGRFASRWWKWAAIPLLLAAAGLLIPTELKIEARGKLQPRERRNVFAPVDGIVTLVSVRHGSPVKADEILLTLHSPELDFDLTRVTGEIQTAEQRLESVRTTLLNSSGGSASDRSEKLRLTADEQEIVQQLIGLKLQQNELKDQKAALVVKSPSAGLVLTWDVKESLDARPVRKGQLLLSIGDVTGPWEVELQVPDDRIGYVNDAARAATARGPQDKVAVEFVSASAPQTVYEATLREAARRSETPREGEATVRVTADIVAMPAEELRPGAVVVAKVHCGRTSLARSWLLDLIHVVRRELLF
jgi:multidrug efflux pump subunit AcrA (membrane-fusion protein)